MKFNWKNFLYFQQGDKRAILILLLLIVLSGLFFVLYDSALKNSYIRQQEEGLSEFIHFENSLEITQNTVPSVSTSPDKTVAGGKLQPGETIELNGAGILEIKRIPGVGDTYAKRIKEYHDLLGGFVSAEQLIEVQGITEKKINDIGQYITLNNKPKTLRINHISAAELELHPYIRKEQANAIVNMRQNNNGIKKIDDLLKSRSFSPRDLDRLSGYVSFE